MNIFINMVRLSFYISIVFIGDIVSAQSVNPDGSLQYDIPIEVPKGAGPTPQLKISYNSNHPNGMLGVGFRLEGLPVITRGNFGHGINYDGNDTYFGPGGRLILQGSASAEPKVYLPQNYNGSRYLAYGSCGDGPCYWVEETAGGAKQYFGTSDETGANSQGRAIAVDNPGQAGSVREWALGRVEDSEGRYFEVEWEVDEGQQYPVKITYTKGPGLNQYHTVSFVYDKTSRPDQQLSYAQSAKVQTRWRMIAISVETEEPLLWGLFSWSNQLNYFQLKYLQINYRSSLSRFIDQSKTLNFEWQSGPSGFTRTSNLAPPAALWHGSGKNSDGQHLIDVNGDGLPDLLRGLHFQGQLYRDAWINTGSDWQHAPHWAPPVALWTSGAGDNGGVQIIDINNDGLPDILMRLHLGAAGDHVGAWLNNGNGWDYESDFIPPAALWNRAGNNPDGQQFVDLNGDGLPDLIRGLHFQGQLYRDAWSMDGGQANLLTAVFTDNGVRTNIAYKASLPDSINSCLSCNHGNGRPLTQSRQLVSNIKTYAPVGTAGSDQLVSDTSYYYENSRYFPGTVQQRASLGFGKITQIDNLRNRRVETTYRQDRRYAGLPLEKKTYIGSELVSHTTHDAPKQYRCDDSGCLEDNTLVLLEPRQVRPGKSTTIEYDLSTGSGQVVEITRSQEVISYDSYGNPTESVESIAANGSTKTIRKYAEYINATGATSIRRMGLPYYQKKTILVGAQHATPLQDGDIIAESYIYFDNQPAGQLGSEGRVTRRESHKAGVVLTENLTYNANGQLVQKVNDAGIIETFEYDSFGHLSKTTVTSGSKSIVREQKIDPRYGVKVWAKDENGIVSENDLDDRGRIIESRMTYNGDILQKATASYQTDTAPFRVTKCKYFTSPQLGDQLNASSCETVISDALGRKIYEISPSPQDAPGALVAIKTEYDTFGRAYRVSEPYVSDMNGNGAPQRWQTKTFDSRDRVVSVTSVDGKTSSTVYNPALVAGSVSSREITGPDGSVKRTFVDLSGQPVLIQEAFGTPQQAELKYTYDQFDRLIKVEAPQGTTEIEYDALGRQRFIKDPHAGMTEYIYYNDPTQPDFSKIKKETRPDPDATSGVQTIDYEYEEFGRIAQITRDDIQTQYRYDETETTFGIGRLTTIVHKTGGITLTDKYSYHFSGKVELTERSISSDSGFCVDQISLPCKAVFGQKYDSLTRVVEQWYPDGTKSTIDYSAAGKPVQLKHEGQAIVNYSEYSLQGQIGKLSYGNGVETNFQYSAPAGLLTRAATQNGHETLLDFGYEFDDALNITRIENYFLNQLSSDYEYDPLERIRKVTNTTGSEKNYAFDALSNLTQNANHRFTFENSTMPTAIQKQDENGQWQSYGNLTWSSAGNLKSQSTNDGTYNFEYNTDHMLSTSTDSEGNETHHYYDHTGERFLKIFKRSGEADIYTWYLGDGLEVREKWHPQSGEKLAEQQTKYIYGTDGKKVASMTMPVQSFASVSSGQYYAYAAILSPFFTDGINGIYKDIHKGWYSINYLISIIIEYKHTTKLAILFIILILVIWLTIHCYCSWAAMCNSKQLCLKPSTLTRQVSLLMIALIMNLSLSNCTGKGQVSIIELNGLDIEVAFDSIYDGLPVGTYYYTHDHLGSGALVTDSSGDEVMRIAYDPYGNIDLASSGRYANGQFTRAAEDAGYALLAIRFAGQEYDPETNLYYYNARFYSPVLGMFTTPDNLIPYEKGNMNLTAHPKRNFAEREKVDGKRKAVGQTRALDMHRYMYVRGNPVKYTDPSGHEPITVNLIVGGTLKWLFSFPTQPPWHRFTGKTKRADFAEKPMTWLDGISKKHDQRGANLILGAFNKEQTPQGRLNNIKADALFIGEYLVAAPNSFFSNLMKSDERYSEWFGDDFKYKALQNPVSAMGYMVFQFHETVAQTVVDIGVGMIGSGLFLTNIVVYGAVHMYDRTKGFLSDFGNGNIKQDFHRTVNPFNLNTYKNLYNPSKWRAPAGKGRFKNWNKPWKWRL